MKILVTGRAGSGKSAVAAELKKRGFNAFDSDDVPGLSSWQDRITDEKTVIQDNSYIDLEKYRWIWDEAVVDQLVAENPDIFLCGGAENDISLHTLFDKHFVLSIEPELQIQRLQERTTNDYGKDPRMFDVITTNQAGHVRAATLSGAIALDASKPIEEVVDRLLSLL